MDIFTAEHRGSRYYILISRLPENCTIFNPDDHVMVAIWPGRPINPWYPINIHGPLHWRYVGEKFGLGEVDAKTVAEAVAGRIKDDFGGSCRAVIT